MIFLILLFTNLHCFFCPLRDFLFCQRGLIRVSLRFKFLTILIILPQHLQAIRHARFVKDFLQLPTQGQLDRVITATDVLAHDIDIRHRVVA